MYEFLEKNKNNILKNLQTLFNNSRLNMLNIDEINALNVTTEVSNLFKKIEKNANLMFEGEIRSLAKSTGKDVDFFELDEYLDDYNPTLQYVYKNELERKKARYVEAIMSIGVISSLAMEELMSKNIRYMNTQIQETLTYMELQGHLDAWEDDGVEYVIWHSEHDNKVCGTCNDLDGQRFKIDECPDLQHIGCRCWVTSEFEEDVNYDVEDKKDKEDVDSTQDELIYQDLFKQKLDSHKDIPKEYRKIVAQKYNKGQTRGKKLFDKYVPKKSVKSFTETNNPRFSPKTIKVYLDAQMDFLDTLRGVGTAYFHEHGHYIDFSMAGIGNNKFASVENKKFIELLTKDYNNYLTKTISEFSCTKEEAYAIISDELQVFKKHGISDVFEGLSSGKVSGCTSHLAKDPHYWDNRDKISIEAFAHFFESMFDNEKSKFISEYMPLAYEEMKRMVR